MNETKADGYWTGHVDEAPHGVPDKFHRELSEAEKVVNALAIKEGITTAAAAEKIRYEQAKQADATAKLSAEDTMKDVSAALLPAKSESGAASA